MEGELTSSHIVGHRIARILHTPCEEWEGYEFVRFFIQLDDGALFEFDEFEPFLKRADRQDTSIELIPVEPQRVYVSPSNPSPLGKAIERVLSTDKRPGKGVVFILLAEHIWMERAAEESGELLRIWDKEEFTEECATCFEFFDFWSREAVTVYGIKAIDFVLRIEGVEVRTMELSDGVATAVYVCPLVGGRVKGPTTGFFCYQQADGTWKDRLVDPKRGRNRVQLAMCEKTCWKDIEIDERVFARSVLHVELSEQDIHSPDD